MVFIVGVTIVAISGENGIIQRTVEAREETEKAEKIEQNTLNSYEDTINEYMGIDWDRVLANAEKHPDQKTSTAIGVGTDGRSVNMDLWKYTLLDDGTYGLNTPEAYNNAEVGGNNETNVTTMGYTGEFENGKIKGTVPQYISTDGGRTFKDVTSMYLTFWECTELIETPTIPDTVTDMPGTFCYNTNLKKVTRMPNSITNMTSTFYGCTNLEEVDNLSNKLESMSYTFSGCKRLITMPNLPDTLTDMPGTFENCTSLTTIPNLPNNLISMKSTFRGCTSLKSIPTMPNTVIDMNLTFFGCTSLTTIPNIPQKVTNMFNTFKNCTNLTTVSSIPESVTNMIGTFAYCTNLQGNIRIDANITGSMIEVSDGSYKDYLDIFLEACKNDGITLKVTGKCLVLQEIITETNNPNITLGV